MCACACAFFVLLTCNLLFDHSARPKTQDGVVANGVDSKKKTTSIDDVLKGLVEWLCAQVCAQYWFRVF